MSTSLFPVNDVDDLMPVGDPTAPISNLGMRQKAEMAAGIAIFNNQNADEVLTRIEEGDQFVVPEAREAAAPQPHATNQILLDQAYEGSRSPEDAAQLIQDEHKKISDWVNVSDQFYLEQAMALGNPDVDHASMVMATNLTTAQTMLADAIDERTDVAGVLKPLRYVGDFADRYFLRAVPIGGIEAITNRPERLGRELLGAASTMEPKQFQEFFAGKIQEWGDEGFLSSDNIFAFTEAMYALETAGEDKWEVFNRTLGILDVAAVGGVLKLGAKGILRAATPLQRVAVMRNPDVAADAAEKMIRDGDIKAHLDLQPEALDPNMPPVVRPRTGKLAEMYENHQLVRQVSDYAQTGAFGRSVKSPETIRVAEDLMGQMAKVANNPVSNIRFAVRGDITGNPIVTTTMGTIKDGSPYPNKAGTMTVINRLKDNGYETARAVPVNPENTKAGYWIETDVRIDPGKGLDGMDLTPATGPIREAILSVFGSKSSLENQVLNDLANMSEGARETIGNMVKPDIRRIEGVKTEALKGFSRILSDLRDGPEAFMRDALTEGEFRVRFENHVGREPTQKEIDAFGSVMAINDTAYIMTAHRKVGDFVRQGWLHAVDDPISGRGLPIKPVNNVDDLPKDANIADMSSTGAPRLLTRKDILPNQKVYRVDGFVSGTQFVTKPPELRTLAHTDVFGYNSGGRRINPDAKFFVTLGSTNPRAVLQAFTEKQALAAVDELKAIQAQVLKAGGTEVLANSNKLDEVIQANNAWNPGIQTTEQLLKWASDKGIDLNQLISYKARDATVKSEEVTFGIADNWGEHYAHTLHRYDDTIMEYGGKEARQRDPVTAIFEDFTSQTSQFSHSIYTQTALASWVKAAARKGSGWEVPASNDPRRAFAEARRDPADASRGAGELDYQRSIIEQRLNMNGEYGKVLGKLGRGVQDIVFDASKGKIRMGDDFAQKRESNVLSLGFQSVFGFLYPAQFVIQGAHATVIGAISPVHGSRAALLVLPMQFAIMTGKSADESIALRRLAKVAGVSNDELTELAEYIRQSGRMHIDGAAIEKGTTQATGASGWKGESWMTNDATRFVSKTTERTLNGMTIPFREGERLSRLTALVTSYLEFKAKNPGISALSDFGRRTISRRDHALSFRMNNAERATIQRGMGKLPTQWWSYTLRSFENMMVGRDFTVPERLRMFAALAPIYGLTGFGMERGADYIGQKFGAEPGGLMYNGIKRGIYDTMFTAMTGAEIDLAGRMAPIQLIVETYNAIARGEKTALQVAGGPSVDISVGFASSFYQAMSDLVGGRKHSLNEDLIRTLRNISSVDNVYKAYGIIEHGVYRSRTGTVFPAEMSTAEGIGQLLGFTPAQVGDFYTRDMKLDRSDRRRNRLSRRLINDMDLALQRLDEGDETGWELMREIGLAIDFSGFGEHDKMLLRRRVFEHLGFKHTEIVRLMEREWRKENPYGAEVVEETFTAPGTGDN